MGIFSTTPTSKQDKIQKLFDQLINLLPSDTEDYYDHKLINNLFDQIIELYCFGFVYRNKENSGPLIYYPHKPPSKEELKEMMEKYLDDAYEKYERIKNESEVKGFKIVRKEKEND